MVRVFEIIFVNLSSFVYLVFLLVNLGFAGLSYFNKLSEEKFFKLVRILFWLCLGFVFLRIFFLFLIQYWLWAETEPSKYFLPPYQPLSYFLNYSWLHFAKLPVFNLGLGLFLFLLIFLGTKLSRGRFFYPEEHYSGGVVILLNPWPANLAILFLVLISGCFALFIKQSFLFLRKKQLSATPLYFSFRYLWSFIGLLVFLFNQNLSHWPVLELLKI